MASVEPLDPLDDQDLEEPDREALILGPGGIDDPETVWEDNEPIDPLPNLSSGEFLLLGPGEDLEVVDDLPHPKPDSWVSGCSFQLEGVRASCYQLS
jgi:hypothetical protein